MAGVDLDRVKDSARRFADGFTAGQKAVSLIGLAALVAGGLAFTHFAGKPSYVPLFSNLQASDAASITQKLSAAKVPYQLAGDGTTILVPQAQVYQERLDMAQAGLPTDGNVGFSLLDKQGVTTSQFTEQVDYQRALQGELEKTIESIEGVQGARVSLAMPPQDAFALSDTPQNPTASVLVDLGPATRLTDNQTQSIVHLVASSIPNLDPGNVTLVDSRGDVLAAPGVDSTAGARDGQTAAFEAALSASIQEMLDKVVGPNKADVRVNANLNFDQVATTSESLQTGPNGAPVTVPLSASTSNETYTGNGTTPGGPLGGTPTTGGQNNNYNKQTSDSTYAVGKVTRTVQQAPGAVQRLSLAVLVDSSVPASDVASIQQLVSAAAGIDATRGDTVTVQRLPFSNADAKQAAAAAAQAARDRKQQQLIELGRTAGLLLLALFAVVLLLRSARKVHRTEIALPRPNLPIIELPTAATMELGAGLDPELERQARNHQEIASFIEEQPDEVARMLRGWLAESRNG